MSAWSEWRARTASSRCITEDRFGRPGLLRARKLIVSTGYYDLPNLMCIPGEKLSKVFHYYNDPHPYFDTDVVVIGGKNSAAIAALELWRSGARVTLVHRHDGLHRHVKYWIKPDIENRIKNGEIKAYFNTDAVEITQDAVVLRTPQGTETIKNDFVFAMTGYHPDFSFLESMGVRFEGADKLPVCDPETLGKQCAWDLSCWCNCGGLAYERNLHRERQISWRADCAGATE